MDLKEKLVQLVGDVVFKTWKCTHQTAYLVHFFYMTGLDIQIGYYEPEEDAITTFMICGTNTIHKNLSSDVFKEEKSVAKLFFDYVQLSFEDAMEKAVKLQKKKFQTDKPTKEIVLLQTINDKPVYNITFVTETFFLLNIRLDAHDGTLLEYNKKPLMDLANTIIQ